MELKKRSPSFKWFSIYFCMLVLTGCAFRYPGGPASPPPAPAPVEKPTAKLPQSTIPDKPQVKSSKPQVSTEKPIPKPSQSAPLDKPVMKPSLSSGDNTIKETTLTDSVDTSAVRQPPPPQPQVEKQVEKQIEKQIEKPLEKPPERTAEKQPDTTPPTKSTPMATASLALTDQAQTYLKNGKPDEAIRVLERAVNLNPQNGENYYYLAEAWIMKRNVKQAKEYNNLAVLRGKNDPEWIERLQSQQDRISRLK